jgi:hypothetical protein
MFVGPAQTYPFKYFYGSSFVKSNSPMTAAATVESIFGATHFGLGQFRGRFDSDSVTIGDRFLAQLQL